MSIDQTATSKDIAVRERSVVRRLRMTKTTQYILYSIFGTSVAIIVPTLLALLGVGMSKQNGEVAFNAASASLLAIIVSFVVVRRVVTFPLLRTYSYVALTFVSSFALVAIGLKFFQIQFSSPQFFVGMVIITALVEIFFYAHRHAAPLQFAVIPGTPTLAQLPNSSRRSIKYTQLAAVPSGEFAFSGVIADLGSDLEPNWENFLAMAALRGLPVHHFKQFNESITGRVALDHLWENTLGAIVPALIYPQFKRGLDFLGALLLLPFIGPLVGICAILVKLETPGPVFFRQLRVGLGGRPFTVFKLRTMAHNHNGKEYTVPDDARITRMGRVLRQYRIDELPQIINILRGDMSWIGPRPEAVSLAEWYESEVPFYVYRHIVRPGISGWAQVHQGNVAEVDAARVKLEYDFFYIKHFSFWLDAVIVVKTVRTIVTCFGSR
jgi:lipopolysaccharide/colanic/teichoic acid biosynthesis glycosyltransferase